MTFVVYTLFTLQLIDYKLWVSTYFAVNQNRLFFAVKIIFRSQDYFSQSKVSFFRSQFESEYKFW